MQLVTITEFQRDFNTIGTHIKNNALQGGELQNLLNGSVGFGKV